MRRWDIKIFKENGCLRIRERRERIGFEICWIWGENFGNRVIEKGKKEVICESLYVNLKREVFIKGSKIFELEGIVIFVDNDVI